MEADARDAADPALEGVLLDGLDGDGEDWDREVMRAASRSALASARTGA